MFQQDLSSVMSLNKYLERAICCHRRIMHPLRRPCANILALLLSSLAQPSLCSSFWSLWLAAIETKKTTVYDLNAKEINRHAAYLLIILFSRLSRVSGKAPHTLWEGHGRFNTREKLYLKILEFGLLKVSRRSQVAHFKSFSQEQIILKQHSEEEIDGKDYRAVLAFIGHCRCSWVFYRPTGWFRESHCMPCLSFPICSVTSDTDILS